MALLIREHQSRNTRASPPGTRELNSPAQTMPAAVSAQAFSVAGIWRSLFLVRRSMRPKALS